MHAVDQLYLYVEVVGCPTICRRCWARGVGYQAMPVGDVAFVLEQAHRFCDEHGLAFGAYPMHEVAAHPQAPAILRLFADHVGAAEFQPLTTTGVPLATRPDWAELLTAAAQLGTTTVWVAFHGVGAEHDRPATCGWTVPSTPSVPDWSPASLPLLTIGSADPRPT